MKLTNSRVRQFAAIAALLVLGVSAKAQDHVRGGVEPIISSIDPSKLTYDILVDGNLAQDDPGNRQFKTLQAAYAMAPPGAENKPTVIGIKPNVYHLPGGEPRTPSMTIKKDYITLLGLTDNRRSVVLADNRGLMQGAEDDGYILVVDAIGFTAKNLTILNYCNTDYEYPGDPSKNLTKRSDVITQAVALQASGDKHVYENVALLSRLDTMFLLTTRSYFKNVYIEGTDDWIGGGQTSVWEDCTLVYPTGSGVMSASNAVFRNCRFEASGGMQFYKAEYRGAGRPNALINCVLPVTSAQTPVAWIRGKAQPRPSLYSLTYHNKDAKGNPAVIYDSDLGAPTFAYSRELSDDEVRAFNPWNLLRAAPSGAADDWDPAAAKGKYEAAGEGNIVYRIALTGSGATIRTGGSGATIGATVMPKRAATSTITWSTKSDLVSLDQTTGSSVVVTARNTTDEPQWAPITATSPNGFYVTAYVYAEPRHTDPPAITSAPTISAPVNGSVSVAYALDLGGREDQSLVSWSICDDASGSKAREVSVSRGNQPLMTLALMPGFAGKFIKTAVLPKHKISDAGPAVYAVAARPIAASDIPSPNVSVNFRNFSTTPDDSYTSGLWTILGPWTVVAADELINGYGAQSGNGPASLLYQEDVERGDMRIDLVMTPAKTAGQGFSVPGSPDETGSRNLHSDVYIKYDPRKKNGYALRFWRTTQSATKCLFQLYRIVDGVGSPIDDRQMLTGVFKPNTTITLKIIGSKFLADAANSVDSETLHLEGTITPNHFGGAGVFWPGGSANVYSRIEISYPGQIVTTDTVRAQTAPATTPKDEITVAPPVIPDARFNLADYGAVGDNKILNTEAFTKAVAAVQAAGGGHLIVPAGIYKTLPFALASHMDLHLEAGATIKAPDTFAEYGIPDPNDAAAGAARGRGPGGFVRPLITCPNGATDLAITGNGKIDGSGAEFWMWSNKAARRYPPGRAIVARPNLVSLRGVERLHVDGITLTNSPSFHLVPRGQDILIENIRIVAPSDAPNSDAIDPGGTRIVIRNCEIDTGDDDVAIQSGSRDILIEDLTILHGHGISIGSPTRNGVSHMIVRRCTFDGTDNGLRIKSYRGNGGEVHDIQYSDITMKNVRRPFDINMLYNGNANTPTDVGPRQATDGQTTALPNFHDIHITNLIVLRSPVAGRILGLPELMPNNITFTNCKFQADRGFLVQDGKNIIFDHVEIKSAIGDPLVLDNASVTWNGQEKSGDIGGPPDPFYPGN